MITENPFEGRDFAKDVMEPMRRTTEKILNAIQGEEPAIIMSALCSTLLRKLTETDSAENNDMVLKTIHLLQIHVGKSKIDLGITYSDEIRESMIQSLLQNTLEKVDSSIWNALTDNAKESIKKTLERTIRDSFNRIH